MNSKHHKHHQQKLRGSSDELEDFVVASYGKESRATSTATINAPSSLTVVFHLKYKFFVESTGRAGTKHASIYLVFYLNQVFGRKQVCVVVR